MKSTAGALVAYSSSEDEAPARKKRKLPSLAPSLVVPAPVDNPAHHQGRVRTTPHVEGQYAVHVYIPLVVYPKTALYTLLEEVLNITKEIVPTAHAIDSCADGTDSSCKPRELHLSLSRPIYLRAHQREDFKKAVRLIASRQAPFQASFATFSEFMNDERTRAFLSLEVGVGHHELKNMLSELSPTLQSLRQQDFYSQPRFHASIAWALLDPDALVNGRDCSAQGQTGTHEGTTPAEGSLGNSFHRSGDIKELFDKELENDERFPRISRFPSELIPVLHKRFGARLSSEYVGGFNVVTIAVKIGKDIFSWPLRGTNVH